MGRRIKISAASRDFDNMLKSIKRLDAKNQARFNIAIGRPKADQITQQQLWMLTEGLLVQAFRAYEKFLAEVFTLLTQGKTNSVGQNAVSYINPVSFEHAQKMLQSAMPFLEWNSVDSVILRADTYLKDGFPIKLPLTANLTLLREIRHIRNHIAHDSNESRRKFLSVVSNRLPTVPSRKPSAGEFLNMTDPNGVQSQYFLETYLDGLEAFRTQAS